MSSNNVEHQILLKCIKKTCWMRVAKIAITLVWCTSWQKFKLLIIKIKIS